MENDKHELSHFQKLVISNIMEEMEKHRPPKSIVIQGRRTGKTDVLCLISKIMFDEENRNLKIWFNVSKVVKSKCIAREFAEFITKT